MKYIIIDLITSRTLYGLNGVTLNFTTESIANEVAVQFCKNYLIVGIKLEN